MSGKSIGATIALGGENEFRNQIKNINAEMGVLSAQLDKNAVSFSGNEKSQEAVTERSRILSQMNEKLSSAVEITKKKHDEVAAEYGENSAAALKLEKDILKLEKQIIINNQALDENTEALDENGEELEDNTEKVSFWSQEVQNKFNTAADMVNKALGVMKTGLTALNGMVTESAQKADEIISSAQKVGMSAQDYQELGYAAEQLDISIDALSGSMKDLGEKAYDAMKDPSGEMASLFSRLDVSVIDFSGNLKDSQQIWEETLSALGNIGNETERDAIAMKLFGGSASELATIMSSEGINTLQMYSNEAQRLGFVLDTGTLRSLEELNETQKEAQATIDGVKDRMAAQLAPSFAQASETAAQLLLAFEPLITDALSWALEHIPEIATGTMAFVGALIALKMVSTLTPLLNLMNTSLMTTNKTLVMTNTTLWTNPVVLIATAVVAAIAGLVAGIALFNDKTEEISDGVTDMADSFENVGDSAKKLEKSMEEVANSIDWESINLDFEAKFAILGSNSASAFKRNLLDGFDGFADDLSKKVSGMSLNIGSGSSGSNTPVITSGHTVSQNIDISLYIDKYKIGEVLYDVLRGIAKQKGMA